MKNNPIFSIMLLAGFALTHASVPVTNLGDTFSPAIDTIKTSDTVIFTLASIHNVQEVSLATYTANGTAALAGGFSTPYGGGKVVGVAVGTHYFVCQTHASMGMKGQLIVQSVTPINPVSKNVSAFTFQFAGSKPIVFNMPGASARVSVVDIEGRTVWSAVQKSGVQNLTWNKKATDGTNVAAGNYFVQVTALDASQKPVGQISSTAIQIL